MAARALALLGLALAVAGVAAADPDLTIPDLAGLVPRDPVLPAPVAAPGVDPPGGDAEMPPPVDPDLVGPGPGLDGVTLTAALGGMAGLLGLALWGAARFRDPGQVLEHEVRSRIYAHVQEHVGASLKEITEQLGLSTTNAVWHLRKLEEGGLVRGRKFNGAKVYYPTAGGVQARDLSIAGAALTNGNARAILRFVADHPGVHQREVARLLDVNHGTVRWHLKKLRKAELLEERRTGASAAYHATALGAEALRVIEARASPPSPAPGGAVAPGPVSPAVAREAAPAAGHA